MKLIDRTKILIIIAFLLSLLFHTSSIIYVLWQGNTSTRSTQSLQEKEELRTTEIQKREEWVETKARTGNFGAPVMFQDTDEPEEPEQKKITPPEEKTIKEIIPEKVTPEKSVSFQELAQPAAIPSPKKTVPKSPIEKKQSVRQKKPFSAPKPPLSLAQLTQGFLNHIKDEGTHAIHMLGKKNGTPSDEQIKYERYLQKISWCLQNSFNINRERFPASATTENNVHIFLALNRDGSLNRCTVAKTSGNIHLDQFVLFNFNDASGSFPPVPQYLPHDPFTVTYTIMINPNEQNSFRMYRR
jgi:outer membrane biosynthesis protein TonB